MGKLTTTDQNQLVSLLTCFMCCVLYGGVANGIPRLLPGIIDTFHCSRAQAGAVIAMNTSFSFYAGAFAGVFVHKCGSRVACNAGILAIAVPFCIAYVATSTTFLLVTIGVVAGSGNALIFVSCLPVICNHFQGRARVMALAFLSFGASLGGMAYSYLIGVLLYSYGLRGACLVIGGITVNGFAMTILWNKPKQMQSSLKATSNETQPDCSTNKIQTLSSVKESVKQIMANKTFLLFVVGNAIDLASQSNAVIYTADSFGDRNDSASLASMTLTLLSLMSALGRLLVGVMKRIPHCSSLDIQLLGTLIGIVGSLMIVFSYSDVNVIIAAWCLIGLAIGFNMGSLAIISVKMLGAERVSTGTGIIITAMGVFSTVGGPLNGYIRDATGSYTTVFIAGAASSGLGAVFILLARLSRLRQTRVETTGSSSNHLPWYEDKHR